MVRIGPASPPASCASAVCNCDGPAAETVEALARRDILAGVPFSRLDPSAAWDDVLLVAATELTSGEDILVFAQALADMLHGEAGQ